MSTPSNALVGLSSLALDVPNNTNLGQDLSAAGTDFGSLIQGVGNAVAATQVKLAQTSTNSASALAKTLVPVIAVQETIFDDHGNVQESQSFVRNLPLINFIDPVFYQWTQVRLQASFFVSEIATASNSHTFVDQSHDGSGQHGLLVIFGGGHTEDEFTATTTDTSTTSDTASAVGIARMYAQLNPRTDIGVPKPTAVLQGPSINLVQGQITPLPGNPSPGTSLTVLVQLTRQDGTPISGKSISIDTAGTLWNFTNPAQTTTDASGNVSITLQRTYPPVPPNAPPGTLPDTTPIQVVVTARLGLVSNSVTMSF